MKDIKKTLQFRTKWAFHKKMKIKLKEYQKELEIEWQTLSDEEKIKLTPIEVVRSYTKVAQIDKKTGFEIQIFDSHLDASKKLGINPANILACLKGSIPSSGGFFWKYSDF